MYGAPLSIWCPPLCGRGHPHPRPPTRQKFLREGCGFGGGFCGWGESPTPHVPLTKVGDRFVENTANSEVTRTLVIAWRGRAEHRLTGISKTREETIEEQGEIWVRS